MFKILKGNKHQKDDWNMHKISLLYNLNTFVISIIALKRNM